MWDMWHHTRSMLHLTTRTVFVHLHWLVTLMMAQVELSTKQSFTHSSINLSHRRTAFRRRSSSCWYFFGRFLCRWDGRLLFFSQEVVNTSELEVADFAILGRSQSDNVSIEDWGRRSRNESNDSSTSFENAFQKNAATLSYGSWRWVHGVVFACLPCCFWSTENCSFCRAICVVLSWACWVAGSTETVTSWRKRTHDTIRIVRMRRTCVQGGRPGAIRLCEWRCGGME